MNAIGIARALPPVQASMLRQLPIRQHAGIGAEWAAIATPAAMARAKQLAAKGLTETDLTHPPVMGRRLGAGFARLTTRGMAVRIALEALPR